MHDKVRIFIYLFLDVSSNSRLIKVVHANDKMINVLTDDKMINLFIALAFISAAFIANKVSFYHSISVAIPSFSRNAIFNALVTPITSSI